MIYEEYMSVLRNNTATVYLDPKTNEQIAFRYPNSSDVITCSKTFKPCHMHYIDMNWQSLLNLVKLKSQLDSNKAAMKLYSYNGPVKDDSGNVLDKRWSASIKGYSISHAIKNLSYQYKNEKDIPQGTVIYLDYTMCRRCN